MLICIAQPIVPVTPKKAPKMTINQQAKEKESWWNKWKIGGAIVLGIAAILFIQYGLLGGRRSSRRAKPSVGEGSAPVVLGTSQITTEPTYPVEQSSHTEQYQLPKSFTVSTEPMKETSTDKVD